MEKRDKDQCRGREGGDRKNTTEENRAQENSAQGDEDQPDCPQEKSVIAREIEHLQSTVLRFAKDRERLPQPLFWSLFNSRIKDIKREKELARLLRETFVE